MTGRARGRSRGRGRSSQPPGDVRRPGGDDAGRGRSRGAAPPAQAAAPPQQAPPPQQAAAPPTQAMAQLSVGGEGGGGRPERRIRFTEIETRPQWCSDKRGTSGKQISLVTNHFKLNTKPGETQSFLDTS